MTNKDCCCPDRCDIEFDYDWKYTNLFMNWLVDNPTYFLNAGDKLTLTLKDDVFDHVYLASEKGKVELTKNDKTWSVYVPATWTQTSSFQVIVERSGRKTLLYQGMLNTLSTKTSNSSILLPDDFIKSGDNFLNISRDEDLNFVITANTDKCSLSSSDNSIDVSNVDAKYDIKIKD